VETLGPGLYGFKVPEARSLAIVTPKGVIFIDPLSRRDADAARAALAKITDQPVKYVIYSHQHWDHILGAGAFAADKPEIIAHAECLKHFKRHPHPDLVMPTRWVKGGETITLGGRSVTLRYFGANHGDCLLVPWINDINTPFIVDLLTPGLAPIGMMPDYDPSEWVRSLRELEAIPFETWFSAHGAAVAQKAAITERRQLLDDVMAIVGRELKAGTPPAEIAGKLDLPQYRHLRGYGADFPILIERLAYFYGMGW
jgi:glyoxylase-like metal-dependent hydrolase (beta-lactamase superfamily II)